MSSDYLVFLQPNLAKLSDESVDILISYEGDK